MSEPMSTNDEKTLSEKLQAFGSVVEGLIATWTPTAGIVISLGRKMVAWLRERGKDQEAIDLSAELDKLDDLNARSKTNIARYWELRAIADGIAAADSAAAPDPDRPPPLGQATFRGE